MNAVNDIGGGAREVISDRNGSFGFRHFIYVVNERTSFAFWASAIEISKLVIGLKWTPDDIDQNVSSYFGTMYSCQKSKKNAKT